MAILVNFLVDSIVHVCTCMYVHVCMMYVVCICDGDAPGTVNYMCTYITYIHTCMYVHTYMYMYHVHVMYVCMVELTIK